MLNVATKNLKAIKNTTVAALCLLTVSCGGNGDTKKANNLLDEARRSFEAGRFAEAIALTDSIKSAYPREIDVRREALHLSTRATEGLSLQKLQEADSLTVALGILGDSLQRRMKFVSNPIEGYYIASTADPMKFTNSTGLQARVSPDGDFYLISSLKGKNVKSTSIEVSTGVAKAATSTVAHDGERNDRSMGAEVITFMGVECDSVGNFVAKHVDEPMTLTFVGASTYSTTLTATQAKEIATAYNYATVTRRFKVASLEKERLTRAVDLARAQAARTFVEKDSVK